LTATSSTRDLADGSVSTSLIITGVLPLTAVSATGAGGPTIGTITQSTTGGSLPALTTLYVSLCAIDSAGRHQYFRVSPPIQINIHIAFIALPGAGRKIRHVN
jgi:hypothetical protein